MIQPMSMYSIGDDHPISPAEILYNAVILQAVKDYRDARRKLKRRPDDKKAAASIRELSGFFRSEYFATLTRVDGRTLLRRLMEEGELQKAFSSRGEALTTAGGRSLVRAEVKL